MRVATRGCVLALAVLAFAAGVARAWARSSVGETGSRDFIASPELACEPSPPMAGAASVVPDQLPGWIGTANQVGRYPVAGAAGGGQVRILGKFPGSGLDLRTCTFVLDQLLYEDGINSPSELVLAANSATPTFFGTLFSPVRGAKANSVQFKTDSRTRPSLQVRLTDPGLGSLNFDISVSRAIIAAPQAQLPTDLSTSFIFVCSGRDFLFADTAQWTQSGRSAMKRVACGTSDTYTDNCNGTVTDSTTGLVWEKKTGTVGTAANCTTGAVTGCDNPHSVNNAYMWTAGDVSPWPFYNTAQRVFLDQLNCQGAYTSGCMPWLGHNDWRLPTIEELSGRSDYGYATGGIVDPTAPGCGAGSPCINPIFGPTVSGNYWSSSANQYSPGVPWYVDFGSASLDPNGVPGNYYVRAVRSVP